MNRKFFAALACCAAMSVFAACQDQAAGVKDPVVKVGKTTLGNDAFEAFQKTMARYPSPLSPYFPAQRQPITFMTEIEAVYQYANAKDKARAAAIGDSIKASLDWAWKERYFAASLFFDLLTVNLGFTDAELLAHYNKNKESFRVTLQTAEGNDSSFIPPFENAKKQAADNLFYEKYPPDSAFLAKLESEEHRGHDHNEGTTRDYWLFNVRSNPADFFMRRFFLERTGQAYNDDELLLYGDDKPVQGPDLDMVRNWVPPEKRGMRIKELIEWLYKWKTFAEHAEKIGLTTGSEPKNMLHWASRVEFTIAYLRDKVLSAQEPNSEPAALDNAIAELLVYDQARRIERFEPRRILNEIEAIMRMRNIAVVDSAVNAIRKSVGITFMTDVKDERDADPAELIARADSLKEAGVDADTPDDAGLTAEAESLYRQLSTDFLFTAQGKRALTELAKILVDRYNAGGARQDRLLSAAILNYRRAQVFETDEENLCNSFFMIGFIYDEHLKNNPLAEANYKWILKNAPDCSLAADAEFMMLHLGEPMTSIEEIQGRSMRQGRKIDFDGEADAS